LHNEELHHLYSSLDQIEDDDCDDDDDDDDEMGRVCNTNWRDYKCIQNFSRKTGSEETTWKT